MQNIYSLKIKGAQQTTVGQKMKNKKSEDAFLGPIVRGSNIWHLTQGASQVKEPVSGTLV